MPKTKKMHIGIMNTAILNGEEDLSVWTEEELIRGQRRNKNGYFQGRPPKIVPKAVHNELVRRRLSRAGEILRDDLVAAVELLGTVVRDDEAAYSDRIKAANIIIERVLGKTPERMKITVEEEPPWAAAIRSAVVRGIVPTRDDVLEVEAAEVEEDDEDDDPPPPAERRRKRR